MNDTVDVVIVGAGPYGLSLAAHLRDTGISYRQFGLPMNLWQTAMPKGMYLKSQGFASNLSTPSGTHTLAEFCAATGRPYADYGEPVALDTFVAYGQWFRTVLAPELEEVLVDEVSQRADHYQLTLADRVRVRARAVVVAAGVEHFPRMPEQLAELPNAVCSHSSAHTDLGAFRGRRVVVLGAGQSALETAALLHENGADVQLVSRAERLAWNGAPLPPDRPVVRRLREPEAGLGSGWGTWFYSNHPGLFRHLPQSVRVYRAKTALGPAGACWLRQRVEGQFPILLDHALNWAKETDGGIRLGLVTGSGERRDLVADHVIAATGYRSDLRRLAFLPPEMRFRLRTLAGTPVVGPDYQSSLRGLYFIGPAVAPTFGPVMRFVFGADSAVRTVAHALLGTTVQRARTVVGADR